MILRMSRRNNKRLQNEDHGRRGRLPAALRENYNSVMRPERFLEDRASLTSSSWLQIAEDRRDQFRDGRVDRHRPLQGRVIRAGVHHVEDAVNRLVAAGPE